MKKKVSSILLTLIFIVGLAIMSYPKVSDYWNSFHASKAIVSYTEAVSGLSEEEYEELYRVAEAYNSGLLERQNPYLLTEEERAAYPEILNVGEDGIMGYIEIPIINVELPIYHGTSENVLQVGVGHLDWTSLPVGENRPMQCSPGTGGCLARSFSLRLTGWWQAIVLFSMC